LQAKEALVVVEVAGLVFAGGSGWKVLSEAWESGSLSKGEVSVSIAVESAERWVRRSIKLRTT